MGEDHEKETNYFDTDFPCDICGKWCRSEADLDHHMKKHYANNIHHKHIKEDDVQTYSSESMHCNFCEKPFHTKRDLMKHRKKEHSEKVSPCWKHSQGICEYGEPLCWFIHMDSSSSTKIKCNDCDETFSIQPLYRIHKKQHHQKSVPLCNNTANMLGTGSKKK